MAPKPPIRMLDQALRRRSETCLHVPLERDCPPIRMLPGDCPPDFNGSWGQTTEDHMTPERERRAIESLIDKGLLIPTPLPRTYDKATLLLACLTCSLIAFGIGFTIAILAFR